MGSVSTQSQAGSHGEQVSALVDGEASAGSLGQVLAGFGVTERRTWADYHAIGDALRSDELAIEPAVSQAFGARFAAAFAAEPHLIAPAAVTVASAATAEAAARRQPLRRRVLPAFAVAAAAATLTWIVVPQLQGTAGQAGGTVQVASVAPQDLQRVAASSRQDVNIIRDASLDQYLEAHQQFAQQPVVSGSMPLIRTAVATQGQ
ncbi:sigma-E factor negative regulatory protein [Burkholderia plantarii]|uniref:sigma-E factor negative regulatory protein n=1 Tax=Burkholderia plantarii TaxID=41899 RepID=UPI0006D8B287|nr:sigma-E factor negative regulatory protein [Burkholderia plantarii]ALK29775.1 Sigma factor algU regulatory protein MucA [Burkholderia plantarii]WLE58530.1 sigma-E factor negative regulatory protein [Burkholderia plantarii]GLZ22751.1 sigma-E factor negative regulatory protein [Burkholderia plantarii]